MSKNNNNKGKKIWFKCLKSILRIFIRKPKIIYLDGQIKENSIVLSNHVGSVVPIKLELYANFSFRYWGTYEMNSGLKSVYKYLSTTYFHQKKHKDKKLSKILAFLVAPFANIFYKGLQLISTYKDVRFKTTLKNSYKTIKNGYNLVIFPEDSSNGYFDDLKHFFAGFVVLCEYCLKRNLDLNIYTSYFIKKENSYIVGKVVKFSQIKKQFKDRNVIAEFMLNQVNGLKNYPQNR